MFSFSIFLVQFVSLRSSCRRVADYNSMYLLPNKNKIDGEGITAAMKDENPKASYFLDTVSGEVEIAVKGKDKDKLTKLRGDSRYLAIPKIGDEKWRKLFRDFLEMMREEGGEVSGKLIIKEIEKGKKEVLKKCRAILEKREKNDGLIYGWWQFESDKLWEEMENWFSTLPIEIEDDWQSDLDSDCELCKLIKNGAHNVGDFREAVQKEKRKK